MTWVWAWDCLRLLVVLGVVPGLWCLKVWRAGFSGEVYGHYE